MSWFMVDVAVIGAGVIGRMSALALSRKGMQVALLDMAVPRPPASWAGGGILSPLFPWRQDTRITALTHNAMPRFQELQQLLQQQTGIDIEVLQQGLLVPQPDDLQTEQKESETASEWARSQSMACELLLDCSRVQPGLNGAGVYFPELGSVRNSRLMDALEKFLLDVCEVPIRQIVSGQIERNEQTSECSLNVDGERLPAKKILVTAGSWSNEWLKPVGYELPLFPVKGEMLAFRCPPGLVKTIVLTEAGYLIPRRDGIVLAGSTMERQDEQIPSCGGRAQLLDMVSSLLPAVSNEELIGQWAGLRPGSETGVPWIGQVPGISNLYLATGHFRNGLVSAPATAELITDLIMEQTGRISAQDYSLPGS